MDLDALKRELAVAAPRPRFSCSAARSAACCIEGGHEGTDNERVHSVGRIAAAVEGRDEWSDTQVAPTGDNTRPVLLRVKHRPAVAVRSTPALDAELLGYVKTDTVLAVDAREGAWARLNALVHDKYGGGDAWVLLRHNTYGPLVDVLSGSLQSLPLHCSSLLTSPEAVAAAEPCGARVQVTGRRRYKVVYMPHVLVRAAPSLRAAALGYKLAGQIIIADAEQGDWLRLSRADDHESMKLNATEAWVLRIHPKLGTLLEIERAV